MNFPSNTFGREIFIEEDALAVKNWMQLRRILLKGRTDSWEGMEMLWDHVFSKKLWVTPDEHPVLVTEHPLNNPRSREKVLEIMFEKFNVPATYLANTAVMSFFALSKGCLCTLFWLAV